MAMTPTGPFRGEEGFREAYVVGLERVLDAPGAGSLVLVYANAAMDSDLAERLLPLLRACHARLAEERRYVVASGRRIAVSREDRALFRQLERMLSGGFPTVDWRSVGPWEAQFNPWRALRPLRSSRDPVSGISAPFDRTAFNFNRPFLRQETIWAGDLLGTRVDLLFNKFPFAPLHALLVPDRRSNQPQLLDRRSHGYAWDVTQRLAERMRGIGLGYNSYGACASVNHLHFQLFVRSKPLPVAKDSWRHNCGVSVYPTECERYLDEAEAWERIAVLHSESTSYNLVYQPGLVYVLPRRKQGTYPMAAGMSGHAWYELAGGVVLSSRDRFLAIGESDIEAGLRSLSLVSGPLTGAFEAAPEHIGEGAFRIGSD